MNRPRHPNAQQFVGLKLFDGIVCFRDLETRIEHLPTEQQRGNAFEVFAEAYFATQRIVAARHVWPDKRISPSLRAKLKLHSRDVGADGVIETVAGKYRGYQAKFRSGRTPLTWTEVATFFGVTDHCDDRLLFTNSEDVSEVTDERKDFSSIRGTDLDSLGVEDFDAIRSWLEGGQIVRETHPPRPYQQQALDAILPALKQQDRATAVMACGTGKTFVALWVAEAIAKRTVLVLVPSLALLRQTLREWVNNTTWERFDYDYLCVCSDPTVSQGGDELIVRPTELEFSVSTKPEQVREFLAHSFTGVKIIFSTYQSADVVARGMPRDLQFDIGIFDEAHKTAGREGAKFSFALKDDNLPIRKRLFLTATPRHYDLKRRDAEGEPVEVYSMNRPEIYGPVVHTLSFAEAAKQKIICNYKVVISVVTSAMLDQQQLRHGTVLVGGEEVKTPQVANQIALAQAVAEHRLKKIFTFHRNVASARSFTGEGDEGICTHLPDFTALHVNGAMSTAARDGLMTEFKAARQAVISNARCLTEGIDVPTVDMVAFLTPKRSKVDIVQAVGRAMRKSDETGKTTGYILIPLYVEQAKGESLDAAVARAEFDEVWAVLQAMQEQDEVLDDLIHQMQAERRLTKGFNDTRLRERVEVLGPTLTLDKLRRAIATRCLDRLARPWDEMVQLLVAYKKQHRHPRVPKSAHAPWTELGLWVDHVRGLKRNGYLTVARQTQLDKLGFCWRVDGQTLDSTEGLLNEYEFRKATGLTNIAKYRKQGLIKSVGRAMAGAGVGFFYHPQQIGDLKKALGITLDCTEGLLNETEFRNALVLTNISKYRKQEFIKPVGRAMTGTKVGFFYRPQQIVELRNALGITLDSTEGLLNETEFKKASGLSGIARYRDLKLIEPVGYAMNNAGISPFYDPQQIDELKKALEITLDNTKGLLNEAEFMKVSGLTRISIYRKRGLITPAGRAMAGPAVSFFYRPQQIDELKKALEITLDNTEGLLNEAEFKRFSGLTQMRIYRMRGLIKPVGRAMAGRAVSYFYRPQQVGELKKALKITLDSTEGLLNEEEFIKVSGLTSIARYRKQGLIKPVGRAMAGPGVGYFYRPEQFAELKKSLTITLDSTKGLLNEKEFGKVSGLAKIADYRKRGLIKPVGCAVTAGGLGYFYRSQQIDELKKALEITLDSTKGLLNETEFMKASGLTQIAKYRKQKLIRPAGRALTYGGVRFFYYPRQIAELKQRLAELHSK